jgi:hypothetical protein
VKAETETLLESGSPSAGPSKQRPKPKLFRRRKSFETATEAKVSWEVRARRGEGRNQNPSGKWKSEPLKALAETAARQELV